MAQYQEAVRDMLDVWSLEHREAQHSQGSLDVLAAKYTDDLLAEGVRPQELFAACRRASRRWAHFPKMSDILAAVDDYRLSPPAPASTSALRLTDTTARADNLTPEEVKRNLERIKMISLVFHPDPAKRVSVEEAVAFVESVGHIGEFATTREAVKSQT